MWRQFISSLFGMSQSKSILSNKNFLGIAPPYTRWWDKFKSCNFSPVFLSPAVGYVALSRVLSVVLIMLNLCYGGEKHNSLIIKSCEYVSNSSKNKLKLF